MKHEDVLTLLRNSNLFDADWYLRTYPDVALSGLSPVEHYARFGHLLGRDPGPDFSASLYLHHNPDIAEKGVDPLVHYEHRGRKGNRRHFASDAAHPGQDPAGLASTIDRRRLRLDPQQARDEVLHILAERPDGPIRRRLDHFDADKTRRFVDGLMSLPSLERVARKIRASVIMPAYNRADTIVAAVRSVLEQSHHELELLLVDDGSTDDTVQVLSAFAADPRLRIFHNPHLGVSAARNTALEQATGDVVFYLDSDNVWTPDFVRLMIMALEIGDAACASGAIRMEDAQGTLLGYRGEPFDRDQCVQGNYVDMNVFCHRRALVGRHGGFDPMLKRTVDWDLILRYTQGEKMIYCPIIGCHYLHDDGDASRISVTQPFIFRNLVQEKHQGGHGSTAEAIGALRLRFAIRIAAPLAEREAWGDYHFAQSLQEALERLGHAARIEFRGEWNRKSSTHDSVAVVLRGLAGDRPLPGQLSLMWNISHPDQIGYDEYTAYHGIFVASSSWAALLSQILGRPVETMLQCTDRSRFGFDPRGPSRTGAGVFVGNSRKTYRDIVRWSVEAGVPLDVHGQDWDDFIPAQMIRSLNVPNRALSRLYASARFVLNDHWTSMRDFGFVSNRVFDVLGCGGRLVSDELASIRGLFGDAVLMVRDQQGFSAHMENGVPALPAADRRAAAQKVLRHHTFDARARQLVDWVRGFLSTEPQTTPAAQTMVAQDRLRVGLIVAQESGQPSASAFVRLLGPLTSDAANNRIELVMLDPAAPRIADLDGVIVQDGALPVDAARALVARLAENRLPLFLDIPADHGRDDPARRVLADAARQIWAATADCAGAAQAQILPDRIDPRFWRNYRKPRLPHYRKGRLRILCTTQSAQDFAPIHAALTRLAHHRPNTFELILTAPFAADLAESWITYLPMTGNNYPRSARHLMAEPRLTVGLAPLPANGANSGLAVLEYCALGTLAIAQQGPGHDALIDENLALGTDGSEQGWFDALARVLDDPVVYDWARENAQNRLWDDRGSLQTPSPMIDWIAQACADQPRRPLAAPTVLNANLPGRQGWLFSPPQASALPASFEQHWHKILRNRADQAQQGRYRAYLGIVPDKAAIYPQHLPDQIAPPSHLMARRVMRAASGLVQSRLFLDDLRDAARSGAVFPPTDMLWTDRGALAGLDRMMADLGLPALGPDDYAFEADGDATGTERLVMTRPRFRHLWSNGQRGQGNLRLFENENRRLPRAVVFGDIFARRQTELLASCFSRLVIGFQTAADFALIAREAPDFVLYLQSERSLSPIPADDNAIPGAEALSR